MDEPSADVAAPSRTAWVLPAITLLFLRRSGVPAWRLKPRDGQALPSVLTRGSRTSIMAGQ